MRMAGMIIVAGAFVLATGATEGSAGSDHAMVKVPTDVSAQSKSGRARTRIRVTPVYPYRLYSTTYPVPYTYEYPGPGAVRQCTSWLARENRPSGPVVVPRVQCWWERD